MVGAATYVSLSPSPSWWHCSKGVKGFDSDEITEDHRGNNLTLTWGTTLLNIFPRKVSYQNKNIKRHKSLPKLLKHNRFKPPATHFHSHIRPNIQYPFWIDRMRAGGLCLTIPPDPFKHLICLMHTVSWTRHPCEILGHHGIPQTRQSPGKERWKSSLSSRQSTVLNQMHLSSYLSIPCGEDPTTEHTLRTKHKNPSFWGWH